jgi:hypothetical protein
MCIFQDHTGCVEQAAWRLVEAGSQVGGYAIILARRDEGLDYGDSKGSWMYCEGMGFADSWLWSAQERTRWI